MWTDVTLSRLVSEASVLASLKSTSLREKNISLDA